jgi:WD40 repeat protein
VFRPDGQELVVGGHAGGLHLCAVTDGGLGRRRPLPGHQGGVLAVAYSPKSLALASGSSDGAVRVWDLKQPGAAPAVLPGHKGGAFAVAFLSDERLVSAGRDKTVRLWRQTAGTWGADGELKHDFAPAALAVCPDGRALAVGDHAGQVILWDPARLDRPVGARRPLAAREIVNSLAFTRDGKGLAANFVNQLVVWPDGRELSDYQVLKCRASYAHVQSLCFAPDGRSLLTGGSGRALVVWERGPGGWLERPLPGHSHTVNALAFTRDGRALISAGGDGDVLLWRLRGGRWDAPVPVPVAYHPARRSLALLSGDRLLAVGSLRVGLWPGKVSLYDLRGETPVPADEVPHPLGGAAAFHPTRGYLAVAGQSGLTFWDVRGRPPRQGQGLEFPGKPPGVLAIGPDGECLAAGNEEGTVAVWQASSPWGRRGWFLKHHKGPVTALAFAGGRTLLSASEDKSVRVFDLGGDVNEARQVQVLTDHDSELTALAVSPDGRTFASADAGGRLVWRALAGSAGRFERRFPGSVPGLAFAPDGRHLAVGNRDGTIYLLRLPERDSRD